VRVRFDEGSRGVESLPDSESATSGNPDGVRG
jgi:hypothetical protein